MGCGDESSLKLFSKISVVEGYFLLFLYIGLCWLFKALATQGICNAFLFCFCFVFSNRL